MNEMHAQAVIANHEAQVDGVNPYTSEPLGQGQGNQRNVYGGLAFIPGTRQPVIPNGVPDEKSVNPDRHAIGGTHDATRVNGAVGGEEMQEINGGHYTNVGGAGDGHVNSAVNPNTIPRSEAQTDAGGLQALPGQGDGAVPAAANPAVRALNDMSVSSLPMPGSFP